jgi:osmoprotectant transport system ATP-binding protein
LIRLKNIHKSYKENHVVRDLSLGVDKGEICVLIGPSGCGKTTTLRMINRMVEPTSGEIFVGDREIKKIRSEDLRRSIGYAIQMVGLFPHMDVSSNISIVPELLKWEKDRIAERVDALLTLVGLHPKDYADKYPHQLSGGEAQRVGVARALAADPPILLMDEPFGAVDPLTRTKLQTLFIDIQKKISKTILLVTHDLDEAIRLADRIAIMKNGELIQFDTPEEILQRPLNKFVYDFVGSDRALKKLSRINIEEFIKPAPFISFKDSKEDAYRECRDCSWIWVVDEDKKLAGWIDIKILSKSDSIKDAIVDINPEEISITKSSSLKEALSIMLSQGLKTIPVVDQDNYLVGELDMSVIEESSKQKDAY